MTISGTDPFRIPTPRLACQKIWLPAIDVLPGYGVVSLRFRTAVRNPILRRSRWKAVRCPRIVPLPVAAVCSSAAASRDYSDSVLLPTWLRWAEWPQSWLNPMIADANQRLAVHRFVLKNTSRRSPPPRDCSAVATNRVPGRGIVRFYKWPGGVSSQTACSP